MNHLIRPFYPRYFSTLSGVSHKFSLSGKRWEISRGLLAAHADSAALVQFGDTAVLAAIYTDLPQNGFISNTNGSPFSTDYSEKQHISTDPSHNFFLRSSRHFEKFALISRSIDRTIRPILPPMPSSLRLSCVLLASDGTHDPEITAINAASAALSLTCTPGTPTCAAVRIGRVNNCWVINPNRLELRNSGANYLISCTEEGISMIQGHSSELSLPLFHEMLAISYEHCREFIRHLDVMTAAANSTSLLIPPPEEISQTIYTKMKDNYFDRIKYILSSPLLKLQRGKQLAFIANQLRASALELNPNLSVSAIEQLKTDLSRDALRDNVITSDVRPGARTCDEIRDLSGFLAPLKSTHGSAIFQRGETQILSSLYLLPPTFTYDLETGTEVINTHSIENFCLRYSNPDYAVRDSKARGMPNRRELGHSRLAEGAFLQLLPTSFPFSVNLFCDVQSSNGSTSMSSICAASLAMLEGGIPIKSLVAGVATGLILGKDYKENATHRILSDIQGIEDALGNMDLKVGGTREGITTCQLDIKEFNGIPMDLMHRCLERSWEDRNRMLDFMGTIISVHRPSLKRNAPVSSIVNSHSKTDSLPFPGWRHKVGKLEEALGVYIYTLSPSHLYLFGSSSEKHSEALRAIYSILGEQSMPELEFGSLYRVRVLQVRQYGLMVEMYPNQKEPSFIPNSQLHPSGILANSLAFKPDDVIIVKYFGVEPVSGRLRISRKAAMCPYEKEPVQLF